MERIHHGNTHTFQILCLMLRVACALFVVVLRVSLCLLLAAANCPYQTFPINCIGTLVLL